jgi:antirestriction protein ArdC
VNYLSRKSYRGINQLFLNGLHVRPFYLTFKQAKDLGGRIKKGSKSIPITYWNFVYRDKETKRKLSVEEIQAYPTSQITKTAFLKYYRVFNIDDVLQVTFDIPELNPDCENYSIDSCDSILIEMKYRPEIRHERNEAFYQPIHDYINMPPIEHFNTSELYYSILFHELIHNAANMIMPHLVC